jgi:hypothetical protein
MLAKDPWSDHCSIALDVLQLFGSLDAADKVKAVIPNSDDNATSRNWRELKVTCTVSNIRILGPEPASGTSQCFQEIVFPLRAQGGSFETRREGGYFNSSLDETVVDYIETSIEKTYGDAIAYMDFLYCEERGALLYGAPIRNDATNIHVAPVRATIWNDTYVPFGRRLYTQLYDNDASLAKANIISGELAVIVTLPLDQRTAQLARLGLPAPIDKCFTDDWPPFPAPEDDLLFPAENCGLFKLNWSIVG